MNSFNGEPIRLMLCKSGCDLSAVLHDNERRGDYNA